MDLQGFETCDIVSFKASPAHQLAQKMPMMWVTGLKSIFRASNLGPWDGASWFLLFSPSNGAGEGSSKRGRETPCVLSIVLRANVQHFSRSFTHIRAQCFVLSQPAVNLEGAELDLMSLLE
uniref:Uncharacterized protein n=1 Tax=Picea sitchensis TaxID=3332 RepID=D5AB26_PICSI|nr:unknown [Picea sitchensis]